MRKQCTDIAWPKFHLPVVLILQCTDKVKEREAEDMITLLHFLVVDAKGFNWTNYIKSHLLTDEVVQK